MLARMTSVSPSSALYASRALPSFSCNYCTVKLVELLPVLNPGPWRRSRSAVRGSSRPGLAGCRGGVPSPPQMSVPQPQSLLRSKVN